MNSDKHIPTLQQVADEFDMTHNGVFQMTSRGRKPLKRLHLYKKAWLY
jgi:hypothetical protein